jgi:hypothetical protein
MCRCFTTLNDVNYPTALLPYEETVCWATPGSEGPPDRAQHVGEGLSRPLVANACLSELLNMLSLRTGASIVYACPASASGRERGQGTRAPVAHLGCFDETQ